MSLTLNGTSGITSPGGDTNVSTTSSGNQTAAAIIPAGATVPVNGVFLPASNTVGVATNSSERMRIDSSGNLLVGAASLPAGRAGVVVRSNTSTTTVGAFYNDTATNPFGLHVNYSAASPNGTGNEFLYCVDNTTARATIRSNGGLANYSANNVNLSDRREKTDFEPAKSYLETICSIPVQTYKYIDQADEDKTLGVVAQDVQAVAPELVDESNWGTEEEPKMRLSIYQTDLQYALMKCIQELSAKNDALEARLAALEAK